MKGNRSAAYFISKELVKTAKEIHPSYLAYTIKAFDDFFDWEVAVYCTCYIPGRREDTFESSLALLPQECVDVFTGIVRYLIAKHCITVSLLHFQSTAQTLPETSFRHSRMEIR